MKYLLSIFSCLLLLTTVTAGFSQNMSEKEWKKRVAGKKIIGQGLYMNMNKDGTISGTYATNNGTINQLRGKWTYTKARGYCREMSIILANGRIRERPYECQKFEFLANGKVSIAGWVANLK